MIGTIKRRLIPLTHNRDVNNVMYSLLSYSITPFVLIVSTPLLLKHLGSGEYGLWVLINSFISVMSISNFGLGNALIKLGSAYFAESEDNKSDFNLLFQVTLTLSLVISIVVFFTNAFFGKYILELIYKDNNDIGVQSLSYLLGTIVIIRILNSVVCGALMAKQRYDLNSKVNIVINLLSAIMYTISAVCSGSLTLLVVVLLFSSVLLTLINVIIAKKVIPGMEFKLRYNEQFAKEVIHYGFYSWSQVIISTFYGQADKFIVGGFFGLSALAFYSVCTQLANKIHEIPAVAGGYLFAKFSALHEANQTDKIRKIYHSALIQSSLFIILSGSSMIVFSKNILALWINFSFAVDHYVFLQLIVMSVSLGAFGAIPYYYLNGCGYVKTNTVITLLISLVTLGLMSGLIPVIGLDGAGLGKMASFPLVLYSIYIVEKKINKKGSPSRKLQRNTLIN